MATMLLKWSAVAGLGAFVETKYGPSVQPTGPLGMNPLYFATPLALIGVGFYTIVGGFMAGSARSKYMKLAKEDGEENVEERYGLPNLYAQGTSKHAKAYNSVQRSHQHIYENFGPCSLFALTGALEFPITTGLATLLYSVGRIVFSYNYSKCEGDVAQRYSKNPLAKHMWSGYIMTLFLGTLSCFKILASTRWTIKK